MKLRTDIAENYCSATEKGESQTEMDGTESCVTDSQLETAQLQEAIGQC